MNTDAHASARNGASVATTMPPEQRVLLCCAGAGSVDASILRAACGRIADWELLLEAADYHGLLPLLAIAMETACPDVAPPDVARRLRDSYRNYAKRALFFSSGLLTLLDALRENGIAAIPLKGPALAELLYADPALRPSSDLDLFVRAADVEAALTLLARQGFSLAPHLAGLPLASLFALSGEALLQSKTGIAVDLQWAIAPKDYPYAFDPEVLWRGLRPARLAGREIRNALSPEALLLFLCVHGAKHRWSRLMWLGDVARLTQKTLDWDLVLQLAAETRCERPMALGLLLAHDVLEAAVPPAVLQRAGADQVACRQAERAKLHLLRVPSTEPGSLELTAFNAALADGLGAKARHYAALLRAPTEAELQLIVLPRKLFFLYYPIRAIRITAKLARRLTHVFVRKET